MVHMLKRYPVLSYCALVMAWSFTWWGLILTAVPIGTLFDPPMSGAAITYMILGGIGPSLMGLILTRIVDGKGSARGLLARRQVPSQRGVRRLCSPAAPGSARHDCLVQQSSYGR